MRRSGFQGRVEAGYLIRRSCIKALSRPRAPPLQQPAPGTPGRRADTGDHLFPVQPAPAVGSDQDTLFISQKRTSIFSYPST